MSNETSYQLNISSRENIESFNQYSNVNIFEHLQSTILCDTNAFPNIFEHLHLSILCDTKDFPKLIIPKSVKRIHILLNSQLINYLDKIEFNFNEIKVFGLHNQLNKYDDIDQIEYTDKIINFINKLNHTIEITIIPTNISIDKLDLNFENMKSKLLLFVDSTIACPNVFDYNKHKKVIYFDTKFNNTLNNIIISNDTKLSFHTLHNNIANSLPQNLQYLRLFSIEDKLSNLPINLKEIEISVKDYNAPYDYYNDFEELTDYKNKQLILESKIPYDCQIIYFHNGTIF